MEALGRLFNIVPIAAGRGLALKDTNGITFVCTGADTFTVTTSATFAGSYTSPGAVVTTTYTCTATNGTAAWVRVNQTAANTVIVASGAVSFHIPTSRLANKGYIKVTPSAAGLVTAIFNDLVVQRAPANLAIVSA